MLIVQTGAYIESPPTHSSPEHEHHARSRTFPPARTAEAILTSLHLVCAILTYQRTTGRDTPLAQPGNDRADEYDRERVQCGTERFDGETRIRTGCITGEEPFGTVSQKPWPGSEFTVRLGAGTPEKSEATSGWEARPVSALPVIGFRLSMLSQRIQVSTHIRRITDVSPCISPSCLRCSYVIIAALPAGIEYRFLPTAF